MLAQQGLEYPLRRITQEDNDIKAHKAAAAQQHQQQHKDDHGGGRVTKKPRNA